MIDLVKSILVRRGRRWSWMTVLSTLALGLVVGTLYAGAPASATAPFPAPEAAASAPAESVPEPPADLTELQALAERVDRLARAWSAADAYYAEQVAPIERVLRRYGAEPELAMHVAVALVREANRVSLEPRLLLAVLLVENPWLDPKIRSPVGAIGLMQVMPVHRGAWSDCEADLEDIDANICHGARIFAHYFQRSGGNVERALLRYNGCVNGTNTPNCQQYPYHVFARAGRASVLAWIGQGPAAGSP